MTRPVAARALAALAPTAVAVAILAATGRANVDEPTSRPGARLTDDLPSGIPLFDVHDASPSERGVQRCIVLRNTGNRSGRVSMRLAGSPMDGGLAAHVDMAVERGAQPWGTPGVGCRGFRRARRDGTFFRDALEAFPTTPAGAVADGGPAVAPGRSRAYRISWSIRDSPAAQGAAVSRVEFVWAIAS